MAEVQELIVPHVISNDEYLLIPEEPRKKLFEFVRHLHEESTIATALLNSTKFTYEQKVGILETELSQVRDEYRSDKSRLHVAEQQVEELEVKAQDAKSQIAKLQQTVERLEVETSQFRHQRDTAVDERDNYLSMIERRNMEAERLQEDVKTLSGQLQAAIVAKCLALSKVDEIQTQQYSLDFKEKRIEQERELFNKQIKSLNDDLNNHSTQLINLRREHTSRLITLETQLTQKTEELKLALESSENLTTLNTSLTSKVEDLTEKLRENRDTEMKLHDGYLQEINAQKKLAEIYKSMSDDASSKSDELEKAVEELRQLLDSASKQYGELETQNGEQQSKHAEEMEKKNECIRLLKEELSSANELVLAVKRESLQHTLEELSPAAAAASRLIKSGMTLTQIYSQYVAVSEELIHKTEEVERLDHLVKSIVEDIEEKTPMLNKQREEYLQAVEETKTLTRQMDKFVEENNALRVQAAEANKKAEHHSRENKRYRTELGDLARQVCHLLNEVQAAHGGYANQANRSLEERFPSDVTASSSVISQKLVLFGDIEELQAKNQNLLAVVRELSSRHEEMEQASAQMNPDEIMGKLKQYEEDSAQMRAEQEQHVKMMGEVIRQRDVYRDMCDRLRDGKELDASTRSDAAKKTATSPAAPKTTFGNNLIAQKEQTIRELEAKLAESCKAAQETRAEHDSYRKERQTNEAQLQEQIEAMRKEVRELRTANGRLAMQIEYAEARLKTVQANADSYRKQVAALEGKNKCYGDTILKHEQAISYLKDEALRAQADSARAEVALENLGQEHRLLKESEARLMAEREAWHREHQGQSLLMSNLESIRASIERVEVDGRQRLEQRLTEAAQECNALRRRLQEEQDRFRELRDNLERKMEHASKMLAEEQEMGKRGREALEAAKGEADKKDARLLELENRVKELLVVPVPSKETKTSAEIMERRLKDLEREYNTSQSRLKTSQQQLSVAQQNAKQCCDISEATERQLAEMTTIHQAYKTTTEKRVTELETMVEEHKVKTKQLSEDLNKLTKGATNKSAETIEELASVKNELTLKNESLAQLQNSLAETQKDLETARSNLENLSEAVRSAEDKYSREVVLHSADIQALTTLKEQVSKFADEVSAARNAQLKSESLLAAETSSWEEREKIMNAQLAEDKQRIVDLDAQNALLHNQIQELSSQLAAIQSGSQGTTDTSFNKSLNVSVGEEDNRPADELLQIIKYLRREKDIAVSKFDVLRLENMRLKSQQEINEKQLDEARKSLISERDQSEVSTVTVAKHSELLRKLDTLNAIMDSNRSLRVERDNLQVKVNELGAEIGRLEAALAPLRDSGRDLQVKIDAMEAENVALRGEAGRLRQRNNFLIERSNKASPEDWRKLQQERENLIRQLGTEKEAHQKVQEETRLVRLEKTRLESNMAAIQLRHVDEVKRMKDELNTLQQKFVQSQQELNETKTVSNQRNEELAKITESLGAKDALLSEVRNKEVQVRKIAKKYKTQYEEVTKSAEEVKVKMEEKERSLSEALEAAMSVSRVIAPETLEEIRAEGRFEVQQQVEEANARHAEAIRCLTEQAAAADALRKEVEALKEASSKGVLILAKQKIVKIQGENTALKQQLEEAQALCTSQEQAKEESNVRMSALKSQYEARVARAEKEAADLRAEKQHEKERMDGEMKTLGQRLNQLQRTLYNVQSQQGKPSTSSGGPGEKPATEPPTANIKPMAGPTSTAPKPVKQAQPTQQTATLTPWTGRGETPFASIRPMSMPSRTVTVFPTSQSSSHANQSALREPMVPVMVAPQQQVVHTTGAAPLEALSSSPTSSHTDYMPATSSAVVRQVIVQPQAQDDATPASCQAEPLAVESTQDNEAEGPTCMMEAEEAEPETQQAVALVQPRVELQTATTQTSQAVEQSNVASSQQHAVEQSHFQAPARGIASSHQQSVEQSTVASSRQQSIEQSTVASSRQQSVEQSTVASSRQQSVEQSTVASSRQQSVEQSTVASSRQQSVEQSTVASSRQQSVEQSTVASSRQQSVEQSTVASSRQQSVEQSTVASSRQQSVEQSTVASSHQQSVEQSPVASSMMSGNNTVTTSQAPGIKRLREMEGDSSTGHVSEQEPVVSPQSKRVRLAAGNVTESGLDVEYQVPTSSQRDQEDEIIIVDSEDDVDEDEEEEEEEELVDEGLEIDAEPEFEDEGGEVYGMEGYDRDEQDMPYDDDEVQDLDEIAANEDNNEVEVLDDSGDEVPNQSECVILDACVDPAVSPQQQHQSEPTSSGANIEGDAIGTSQPFAAAHLFTRGRAVPPLNRQQQTLLLAPQSYEDQGDDSIVPSTPTLFVPRRSDGFSEAVSSPQVPQLARFTFAEAAAGGGGGGGQVGGDGMDDTRMDLTQLEEGGTGRSVPTTPLLPQACVFSGEQRGEGVAVHAATSPRAEVSCVPSFLPIITVTDASQDGVVEMPPPGQPELLDESNSQQDTAVDQSFESDDVLELTYSPHGFSSEGVSSEGDASVSEKPQTAPEMDEGREAEASEHPSVRTPQQRGTRGATARRSGGRMPNRNNRGGRGNERRMPIVWNEPGSSSVVIATPSPIRTVSMREPPSRPGAANNIPVMLMQQQPPEMAGVQRGGVYPLQRGMQRGRRMRGGRPPKGFNNPYSQNRF